jgi:hypothetical protein
MPSCWSLVARQMQGVTERFIGTVAPKITRCFFVPLLPTHLECPCAQVAVASRRLER